MTTYSDWQQRQLDIETQRELDRRPMPVCRCTVCGSQYHIWCNRRIVTGVAKEAE